MSQDSKPSGREQYPPHLQRAIAEAIATSVVTIGHRTLVMTPTRTFEIKARGRVAKPRSMNKIEADWGEHLRLVKKVAWTRYEGLTLKLADDTRYTPDWPAMMQDGELRCYEVKGPFKREDAMVKLKVAASIYPFRFFLVTRENDKWVEKEVRA